MAQSTYIWAQSEVLRRKVLPAFYTAEWSLALDLIKKGEVEKIGERDYRIPFELSPGGQFRTYDPNFGDMGRGSAATGDKFISTFFNVTLNFELPHLAIKATKNSTISVKRAFPDLVKKAMPEMMLYLDKTLHSDGTAKIGTAIAVATVTGSTEYTMDTNTGVQLLRRGQPVTVYDSTFATQRDTTKTITWVDFNTRKVRLSGTVTGAAATDLITFGGVSGASPSGFKGLYYFINQATSGSTLGITRSSEPEIVSSYVNCASASLSVEHGMFLLHKMKKRRGELASQIVGLAGTAQQASVFADLVALQRMDIQAGNSYVDRLPKSLRKDMFTWCTVPHHVDIHQDESRIDWLIPSTWGKAELAPIGFFETPSDGQRFFNLVGGSGAPAAGVWFGLTADHDYYCVDPGAQGLIYNIAKPTLYSN